MRSLLLGRDTDWRVYLTKAPFAANREDVRDAFESVGEVVLSVDFVSEYLNVNNSGSRGDSFSSWIVKVKGNHGA